MAERDGSAEERWSKEQQDITKYIFNSLEQKKFEWKFVLNLK